MGTSKGNLEVRRLRAGDARQYRPVLLEGLIVHPDCFLEDYAQELLRSPSAVEEELERTTTLGIWSGKVLAAIGSSVPCTASKRKHCGQIKNLYVRERFRRKGFGSCLLQALLTHSGQCVERLEVEIPSQSENAVRLFENFGFVMCGLSPDGLRVGKSAFDVWTMVRPLR